jgi:hypothetical protein
MLLPGRGSPESRWCRGLEDVANLMAELAAQFTIEVGERLVEQQQLRLRRQGAGQGDTLLLAAGKLMREALAEVFQVDQFQQLFGDAAFCGCLRMPKAMLSATLRCGNSA